MKQAGIALVQVLLLSAILMIMMLSIHQDTRRHLQTALEAKERAQASLSLQTMESELLFTLLTQRRRVAPTSDNPIVRQWNFYNQPFELPHGTVAIEDVASLLSPTSPTSLQAVFSGILGDDVKAKQLVAALVDWQDADNSPTFQGAEQSAYPGLVIRNGPLQTESELRFLHGMTETLYCQIVPHVTVSPRKYVNYFLMPDSRQSFFMPPGNHELIKQARAEGTLTHAQFEVLSGRPMTDYQSYSPSETLRLTFTAYGNNVKLSRRFTVTLQPISNEPFKVWDYFKNYYADSENCL